MAKKGPVFKNKNKKNRDGTNCNDSNRVVAGLSPNDPIFYSRTVQKSVEHYIVKYNLKCSLLQFTQKMNFSTLFRQNKVSNEFLEAFICCLRKPLTLVVGDESDIKSHRQMR